MIAHPNPPGTQRRFANTWLELDYLCKKVHYWLHVRNQSAGAERYLGRLEEILNHLPSDDLAILRAEGYALLFEARGEVDGAIENRQLEIRLMERLHREANSAKYRGSTRAFMLKGRGSKELEERRSILKSLKAN